MTGATSGGGAGRRRAGDLLAGLGLAVALAGATWSLVDLPATYVATVLGLYALAASLILALLPDELPRPGLGAANRVTLGRLIATLALAGLLTLEVALGPTGRWLVVCVGTAIMLLDGLDGRIARRTRTETAFGARFDMETDALLMLVLSALVWTEGRADAWVLLIGAMRYLFVAAGWVLPALRAELSPSLRRKVVCVVQGIALLVALGPIIPAPVAVAVCVAALALLGWSFAVDGAWLLRGRAGGWGREYRP